MKQLHKRAITSLCWVGLLYGNSALGATTDAIADLRQEVQELRHAYEARIDALEARIAVAERDTKRARSSASEAVEMAEEIAIDMSAGSAAANAFNPAIGVVLVARAADIDRRWETIPGFIPGGELGPGKSGFSLGESEVNLKANIDDLFFGNVTLALEDEDGETEIALEEAWFETTALPAGITVRAGRQFSGIGYLNSFHRHADDFIDRPLPYQAFLGGQYIADGAQARWVAPTDLFMEFGAELDWGSSFPASANDDTSPGAWSLFAHVGGDIGASHAWQAGASYLSADVQDRGVGVNDPDATPGFTGDSDLVAFDFVWKWAPLGNPTRTNFKLQGEYFRREEKGVFDGINVDNDQSGWYLQGVWQFMPNWRVGYRHDRATTNNGSIFVGTVLEDAGDSAHRDSLMLDWSHSDFSRFRLQYVYDQVLPKSDSQLLLQYIMSVGAHGAHRF
jgi:hypothetical protein